MVCGNTCAIAAIFLIANIFTVISSSNITNNHHREFTNSLTDKQRIIYNNIVVERRNIYYAGFILGIILSLLVLFINKKLTKYALKSINTVCMVGTITFITNYLFYILYPKTNYMLLHLNDKKQIEEWFKIYKLMQFKYHLGFVLGIISVVIFTSSFA